MDVVPNAGERFMCMFAKQGTNNIVTGIDASGFVQRLLLFDHCIIASVWLRDVQRLLGMVDPDAFCELLDTGALSFYMDSATTAEVGQARSTLNFTGRNTRLADNEFQFMTIRGRDEPGHARTSLHDLSQTSGIGQQLARKVADRVETHLLEQRGLEVVTEAHKEFYRELRNSEAITIKEIVSFKLHKLGIKPKGLPSKWRNLKMKNSEFIPI